MPPRFLSRDSLLTRLRELPPDITSWSGNVLAPDAGWASDRCVAFLRSGARSVALARRLVSRHDADFRVDTSSFEAGIAGPIGPAPPRVGHAWRDEAAGSVRFDGGSAPLASLALLRAVLGDWSALSAGDGVVGYYADHHLRGAVYIGAGPQAVADRPQRVRLRDLVSGEVFEVDASTSAVAAPVGLDPGQPSLADARSAPARVRYHHGPRAPRIDAPALVGALGLLVGRVALLPVRDADGWVPARSFFVADVHETFAGPGD